MTALLAMCIPVAFVLQFICVPLLIYKVVVDWRPYAVSERPLLRVLTIAGALLAPILMLATVSLFEAGYQGERGGHWFYHIHSSWAGLALVPMYAFGSIFVSYTLTQPQRWTTSRANFFILSTLLVICVWYIFATLFLKLTREVSGEMTFLIVVPAIAAVNYGLLIADIQRHQQPLNGGGGAIAAWISGLLLSLVGKCFLAYEYYLQLPAERPPGYGDCFVVTATTNGHPNIVNSRFDPILARTVTRQWQVLRRFEDTLAERHPSAHRHVRKIYNQIGPPVAGLIINPWLADVVFVTIKPLEWFAVSYLYVVSLKSHCKMHLNFKRKRRQDEQPKI